MKTSLVCASIAVMGIAGSGCSADDPPEGTADGGVDAGTSSDGGGTDATGADAGAEPVSRVQDHWIYETIWTADDAGERVDLEPAIDAHFSGAPDRTVPLTDGVEFQVYDALNGYVVDDRKNRRDDVEVVAGFVKNPERRALAAVATLTADAARPLGPLDSLRLDLTFLGDLLVPGDVILVDMAFLQSYPPADPSSEGGLSGLELLTHRMEAGRVSFFGEATDGEGVVHLYGQEMGVAVEGSTEAEMPAKSKPMLDGFTDGIDSCRDGLKFKPSLSCVADYWEAFGEGAADSLDLITCNLDRCCPEDCPDPPGDDGDDDDDICLLNCGSSNNDPHIVTLDGTRYDLQLVGEFVAARGDAMEVQIRTAPWDACVEPDCPSRVVSMTSGVATEVDGHRVNICRSWDAGDRGGEVLVDGSPAAESALTGDGMALGAGNIRLVGNRFRVEGPAGDLLHVLRKGNRIDIYFEPASEGAGTWVGLFGDGDGDPANDLKLRDGTAVDPATPPATLYETFGEDWRLSDAESLFDYADGESTATYTDRTFPDEIVTVDTLPAEDRAHAEAVCKAAGIIDDFALDSCILDFAMTGDIDVVRGARVLDIVAGIRSGARRPDGTLFDETCADYDSCVEEACGARDLDLASRSEHGPHTHVCPRGCITADTVTKVYGTDIYSAGSSVCRAAIHYGVIADDVGGEATFWFGPEQYEYTGSTRNGITSQDWGYTSSSLVFEEEWSCDDGTPGCW